MASSFQIHGRFRLPISLRVPLFWVPLLVVPGLPRSILRTDSVPRLTDEGTAHRHSSVFLSEHSLQEYVQLWREYDISPPSADDAASATLQQLLREQTSVACPVFSFGPNKQELSANMRSGPVFAEPDLYESSRRLDGQPRHLFISGPAYGGTTALYSLISTSPAVSNLCSAQSLNCEGSWLLIKEGLMSYETRWDPTYPQDWIQAVEVYKQYWNLSQPILVEKSPNSALKFSRIWNDLHSAGEAATFLYIVRSPCYPPHHNLWEDHMDGIAEQLAALRAAGARVHVVRLEELLIDPYGVAQNILQFMPRLGSLDPARAGLGNAPMVEQGDERSVPIADFIYNESPFWFGKRPTTNMPITTSPETAKLMADLGYAGAFSTTASTLGVGA